MHHIIDILVFTVENIDWNRETLFMSWESQFDGLEKKIFQNSNFSYFLWN